MQRRLFALTLLAGGGLLTAGCGGGGGEEASPPPAPPPGVDDPATGTFVYVARPLTADVSVHQLLASGALRPVGTAPAEEGASSVAIHASGRFAYVVNQGAGTISLYDRNLTTGALTFRSSLAVPGFRLGDFHFDPLESMAYVSIGTGIRILSVDETTGVLQLLGNSALFSNDAFDVAPAGRLLFGIGGASGSRLASYVVEPDESLTETSSVEIDGHNFPKHVVASPSAEFLYVSFISGGITVHGFDSDTAGLTAPTSLNPETLGPFAVHPLGGFAYAAAPEDFDAETSSEGIAVMQIHPDTGALARSSFVQMDMPIEFLTISPSGRSLYTMSQAIDGQARTISGFSIDATTGALTSLGSPVELGGSAASLTLFDSDE